MTIDDILKSKEWQLEVETDERFPYRMLLVLGLVKFEYGIPPYEVNFSNLCPDCKMVHDAATPHFPNSVWVGKFIRENWRLPHWCDLIKCCKPYIQETVRDHLEARGQWSVPREDLAEEEKIARELGDLPVHSTEANVKEVSKVAVESEIEKTLNPFVGCPNDERTRAAIKDAVVEVMRKSAIDGLRVDASVDPARPDQINVSAEFFPRLPIADIRVLKIQGIIQGSEGEDDKD
jgi:hypothetical protein